MRAHLKRCEQFHYRCIQYSRLKLCKNHKSLVRSARIVTVRSIPARFSGPPYRMSIRYGYRSGGTKYNDPFNCGCGEQRRFDECYVAPPHGRTRDNGVLSDHFANWCVHARKVIRAIFATNACRIQQAAYIHAWNATKNIQIDLHFPDLHACGQVYTLWRKKTAPFHFCNNFVNRLCIETMSGINILR